MFMRKDHPRLQGELWSGPPPHFCVIRGNKRVAGAVAAWKGQAPLPPGVRVSAGIIGVTGRSCVCAGMIGLRSFADRGGRWRNGMTEGYGYPQDPFNFSRRNHEPFSRKLYIVSIVLHSTETIFREKRRAVDSSERNRRSTVNSQRFERRENQTQDPDSQTESGAPSAHFLFRTEYGVEFLVDPHKGASK